MTRSPPLLASVLAALLAALPAAAAPAADPVYFGAAARGPLDPEAVKAFRAAMERALAKKGIRVLDASSAAADTADRAQSEAKAALEEATAAFSDGDPATALADANRALAAFEEGPAFSDDDQGWALFRDIQSLRALSLLKLKKKKDADDAVRSLLVVLPRYAPNREKAPPELIRHVDDVRDELRSLPAAPLEIRSKPGGAKVLVDGRGRGRSPVLLDDVSPGIHYVTVLNSTGRYTERVFVGDAGAKVEAKLGSKKGAAAHDVVTALSKPLGAKKFVEAVSDIDEDVLVAVLLPAGKRVEVVAARVVGGEVKAVMGVRSANNDNDRERACYVLVEGLLDKTRDGWLDDAKADDPATLRPKLFEGMGTVETEAVEDEPKASIPSAYIAAGIVGGIVVVAAVGGTVGLFVSRELRKDQGFTFDVDTSQLPK